MAAETRKLATFMFTDMVGYSALAQKNDTLAAELLAEHRQVLRSIFSAHGGQELDAVGDGFLVEFASAVDAARCAVAIQQRLRERNAMVPADRTVQIRVGLHVGEVVIREGRAQGDGVNIAARIEPLAAPGGICLSEDVARQIQNKIDLPVRKLGKGELKNIRLPVDIYRVVLPWEGRQLPFSERVAFSLRRRQVRRTLTGALVLVVLVVLVGLYVWQRTGRAGGVASNRIAVLPFASLSADRNDEYFADGITEELISRLSRVGGLEVIARTSVMSYKGTAKKIAQIGGELNVGTVLEGSVRKAGDKLRITAQLIRVDNEAHLWSEEYDRDLKDVFAIQRDVANRVAGAMAARLGTVKPAGAQPKGTQSVEAFNAYLKGRFHANKANEEGLKRGIEYFEDAVRRDPSYALAYAALADTYEQFPTQTDAPPKDVYPKARSAALQALELDQSLGEAHAALGVVKTFYDWDWSGAGNEFRHALALNPNSAVTHRWYAWYLLFLRRYDEGIAEMRRALELDPVSIAIGMDLGWAYHDAGRWDESIEQFKKALEMDPKNYAVLAGLGWAYLGKKMFKEAEAAFVKEVEAFGRGPMALTDLAAIYAMRGDTERALAIVDEMKKVWTKKPFDPWMMMIAYYGLATHDDRYSDEMFKSLSEAYEFRSYWLAHTSSQWFTPFHSDPRWIAFRKKMGLSP